VLLRTDQPLSWLAVPSYMPAGVSRWLATARDFILSRLPKAVADNMARFEPGLLTPSRHPLSFGAIPQVGLELRRRQVAKAADVGRRLP
jgi:hypothetical protein